MQLRPESTRILAEPIRVLHVLRDEHGTDEAICIISEEKGLTPRTINTYKSGLRVLYNVTLDSPINGNKIPCHHKVRRFPDILTRDDLLVSILFTFIVSLILFELFFHSFRRKEDRHGLGAQRYQIRSRGLCRIIVLHMRCKFI